MFHFFKHLTSCGHVHGRIEKVVKGSINENIRSKE